jgi:double zinc ribbon protein
MLASFISSGTAHAVINGLGFFGFVLWLSLGYWTYKDAKRRIEDPMLIALSTVLALIIPFVGPFIYMLFRPPEYLEDVRERELEIKAMEERLTAHDQRCPVCHAEADPSYLVCPVCTTKLKHACASCGSPLEPIWQICPHCETPIEPAVPGTPPALGTRRRRLR